MDGEKAATSGIERLRSPCGEMGLELSRKHLLIPQVPRSRVSEQGDVDKVFLRWRKNREQRISSF